MHETWQELLEQRIQKAYAEVPDHVKENIVDASIWAKETLTNKEGSGHIIEVSGTRQGLVVCSFAKPEWAGDHCGRAMDTGSEAIVIAVCEYISGA